MKRLFVILSILVASCVANAEILYNIIDLGGDKSEAYSINNNGQIVGLANAGPNLGDRPMLFDTTGGGNNIELGTSLGGHRGCAYSINNKGQAVGYVNSHAVLFDTTGNNNDIVLGTLADDGQSGYGIASAINDNGQITGHSKYRGTNYSTAFFDQTGNGNNYYLWGRARNDYTAINNLGQVVGGSVLTTFHPQAVLFDITGNGNNVGLGTLGGTYSDALGINDNGQIVGRAHISGNRYSQATLFDPTGNHNNISLDPFGSSHSGANSINNIGQIVGLAGDRATLFDITGAGNNIDLNDVIDQSLGWYLREARDINDNGWIVGYGINPNGDRRAYLLTPVPEPCSLLLLGVSTLLLRRRIKGSRQSL